jgi:ATP-dependent protease ClpP protease subunit
MEWERVRELFLIVMMALPAAGLSMLCFEWVKRCINEKRRRLNTIIINGSITSILAESIRSQIRKYTNEKEPALSPTLDLVINTGGGSINSCFDIASTIRSYPGKWRTWIPHWARSGGTIIAIAAMTKGPVVLNRYALLGKTDAGITVGEKEDESKVRVTKRLYNVTVGKCFDEDKKITSLSDFKPAVLEECDAYTKTKIECWIREMTDDKDVSNDISDQLIYGQGNHVIPIDHEWCLKHKLPISKLCVIPQDIFDLVFVP